MEKKKNKTKQTNQNQNSSLEKGLMDQVMTAHESIMVRALYPPPQHLIYLQYATWIDPFYPRTVFSMKIWLQSSRSHLIGLIWGRYTVVEDTASIVAFLYHFLLWVFFPLKNLDPLITVALTHSASLHNRPFPPPFLFENHSSVLHV